MSREYEYEPLSATEMASFPNQIESAIQAKLKYDQITAAHQAVFDRLVNADNLDAGSMQDDTLNRLHWHGSVIVTSLDLSIVQDRQLEDYQELWFSSLSNLKGRRITIVPRREEGQLVEAIGGSGHKQISPLRGPASGKLLPQIEGGHKHDFALRFDPDRATKKRHHTGFRFSSFYYAQIINPTTGLVHFDLSFK